MEYIIKCAWRKKKRAFISMRWAIDHLSDECACAGCPRNYDCKGISLKLVVKKRKKRRNE